MQKKKKEVVLAVAKIQCGATFDVILFRIFLLFFGQMVSGVCWHASLLGIGHIWLRLKLCAKS